MKTVSLAEALRSGKRYKYRIRSNLPWLDSKEAPSDWSADAILHAECQIIEEPREIWVWEYSITGNLTYEHHDSEEECKRVNREFKGRPVKFREVTD